MAQGSGFSGKRCFITGAASGIGRATALKLAADGAELYLTDRDAEGLEKTVLDARALGAKVPEHRALDISDYDEVAAFAADIHTSHPAMDVVMNIAGVSAWGTVDQLTHQHWKSMIDINLMGPIHVIETFLPPMVAAGRGGHLVNVSSAAGLVALPWHAAYSASKYGLRGLSEVLRFDLARHRIGVSVVVPGAVKTPLVQSVQIAGVDRDDPRVQKWISCDDATLAGRHGVERGEAQRTAGLHHAGQVVAGEDRRLLDRPGRGHVLRGPHLVEGFALPDRHQPVEEAKSRGAAEDLDPRFAAARGELARARPQARRLTAPLHLLLLKSAASAFWVL